MSRVEHLLGLTPTLKRLAFYYLKKGVGEHPSQHPGIADKIVVRELYPWGSPSPDLPAQGGLVVEFHTDGKRTRWVEFGCHQVGGGGEPIIREV